MATNEMQKSPNSRRPSIDDDSESSSPFLGPFSGPWKGVEHWKRVHLGTTAAAETPDAPADIATPSQHLSPGQPPSDFLEWLVLHGGDEDEIRFAVEEEAKARQAAKSGPPTPNQDLNSGQPLSKFREWLAIHVGDEDDIRYLARAKASQARQVADNTAPPEEDLRSPITFPCELLLPWYMQSKSEQKRVVTASAVEEKKPVVTSGVVEAAKPLEAEISDASADVPAPTRTWVFLKHRDYYNR
jgi:hypothetical protein